MTKSEELFKRRKAVVADGVGIFTPATIVKAEGATFIDADGKKYIDFAGGIGVLNAGHCPPEVVKAVQEQAAELMHACFHIGTYEPYIELCEKLVAIFPHGNHTKVMLTNTGAESVENAVKIARQATGKGGIICFTDAFHGRSLMALSLTSKIDYKIGCGPFASEVYRIQYPNYYRYNDGLDEAAFVEREIARFKESLRNMAAPDNVAAVIIELVQGEGGFVVAPKKYVQALREICTQHNIVLIIDEVQSGFGRTGAWGAYLHYGITPDISTWAKSLGSGLPIGAVIGKAEVMDKAVAGTIGGTYLGNPVACAAAIATLKYMEKIDINAKGRHVGEIIRKRFIALQKSCPAVGDVRGLGGMMAMELVQENNSGKPDADLCKELMSACIEKGLLLVSAGTHKNIIRVLSPLVITDEELNSGLDIIEGELTRLLANRSTEKQTV